MSDIIILEGIGFGDSFLSVVLFCMSNVSLNTNCYFVYRCLQISGRSGGICDISLLYLCTFVCMRQRLAVTRTMDL